MALNLSMSSASILITIWGLVFNVGSGSKSGIIMSMKDISATSVHHQCSKLAFLKCERKFEEHVEAVAAFKVNDTSKDKQELWCQVLAAHGTCMNDVLKNCLADYPTLSSKVKDYLKQVVHKACSHQGDPIVESCVKNMKSKRKESGQSNTLYDLAKDCRKADGEVEPSVMLLIDLLNNLQKSRQHLYKHLPNV